VPTFNGGFKLKQAFFGYEEGPWSKALAGEITPELLASMPEAIIAIYTVPSQGQVSGHYESTKFMKKNTTAPPAPIQAQVPAQVAAQVCEEKMIEEDEEEDEDVDDDDVSDDSDDDDSDEADVDDVELIPIPAITMTSPPVITGTPGPAVKAVLKVSTVKPVPVAPKVQFGKVKARSAGKAKASTHSAASFKALFSKSASSKDTATAAAAAAVTNGPQSERVVTTEIQALIDAMPAMALKRTQYPDDAVMKGEGAKNRSLALLARMLLTHTHTLTHTHYLPLPPHYSITHPISIQH